MLLKLAGIRCLVKFMFELPTLLKLLFLGDKQTVSHNRRPWEVSVFSDNGRLEVLTAIPKHSYRISIFKGNFMVL